MATLNEWQGAYDDAIAAGDTARAQRIATSFAEQNPGRTLQVAEPQQPDAGDIPQTAEPPAWYDPRGLAQSVSQGATFGFGDEAVAGIRALGDYAMGSLLGEETEGQTLGDRYQMYLDDERRALGAYQAENPYASLGADIAGGFGAPALAVKGIGALSRVPGVRSAAANIAGRAGQQLQRLPPFLRGPIAQTIGIGAAGGAAEGAGRSEADTMLGRLGDAATGAGWGALLNPTLQGGMQLGGMAAEQVRRAVHPAFRTATANARAQLGRLLSAEGIDAEKIAQRIRDLGPEAAPIDLSRQTQELAAASRAESDVAGRMLDDFLEDRQATAGRRITGYLEEAAGQPAGAADVTRVATETEMQRIGRQEYPAVERLPIDPEGDITRIMDSPYVKPLVDEVRKSFRTEYLSSRDPFDPNQMTGTVQLRMFNRLKQLMDDKMIELDKSVQNYQRAEDKTQLRVLGDVRDKLVKALDQQVDPGADIGRYQRVRGLFEDQARKHDAVEAGAKLAKTRGNQLDELYERVMGVEGTEIRTQYDEIMSAGGVLPPRLRRDQIREADLPEFRQGAVESMTDMVGMGGPYSNMGARLTRDDDALTRLRLLSESDEAAKRLDDQLSGEAQQFQSMAFVNPQTGSRTAVLEAAGERAEEAARNVGALATSAVTADATPVAARLWNQLRRSWTPEVADEMARLLTTRQMSAEDIRQIMRQRDIPPEVKQRVAELAQQLGVTVARQEAGRMAAQ